LTQQLATLQTDAQSLREKLAAAQSGTAQQTAQMTELEAKVQRLNAPLDEANASLDSKDKMIAFDKDLMLHDRDIRDVIGARNLYTADIYDTNSSGSTAKPFGLIFYIKDSSLVFYGFDLDKQAGVKRAAAFQAWGSGTGTRPVSLGLFYQEDGHRHWVLKCKDAATLARLNMVFVTVEPPGGSNKPTGKQFLRAYPRRSARSIRLTTLATAATAVIAFTIPSHRLWSSNCSVRNGTAVVTPAQKR
jgi:hypothetical protein